MYIIYLIIMYPCRKHARLWACTWPPVLHAGNPPDIPYACVSCICIGNVNNMPSILHQYCHRKVYRKFCPILHQDMSWKFLPILHKDCGAGFMIFPVPVLVQESVQESVQEIVPYTTSGPTCHGNSQLS